MNTITNNNYFYQKAIHDYQKVKACIGQGFRIPEAENLQLSKKVKEDYISEKLVTNLNGGIGRMIKTESEPPSFGWGRGFIDSMTQIAKSRVNNK